MHGYFACVCVCAPHPCSAQGGQKTAFYPAAAGVTVGTVSSQMGAGNQALEEELAFLTAEPPLQYPHHHTLSMLS